MAGEFAPTPEETRRSIEETRRSSRPYILTFQLTRPMRGATHWSWTANRHGKFQLTRPMRGATRTDDQQDRNQRFQLTRPMRGATAMLRDLPDVIKISTHTPHAGRDCFNYASILVAKHFNSHAPCGARRSCRRCGLVITQISTHTPHAGRDSARSPVGLARRDFNSHAPCGARPRGEPIRRICTYFNSHAPCGARLPFFRPPCFDVPFQLTRPMRGATQWFFSSSLIALISTHTPHAGRDADCKVKHRIILHFNSHAPCGARRAGRRKSNSRNTFQLTRPMRGATPCGLPRRGDTGISTHTPHAGRDHVSADQLRGSGISTHTPHAGRDLVGSNVGGTVVISTHTPHAGRDVHVGRALWYRGDFNSHAPCGARHFDSAGGVRIYKFQLTRPMRGAT